MSTKLALFSVLLLESISAVCCYDYNVGGMVAASLVGFILLIAIVLMIIVAVLWRDWYMRRQARRGRYRIPRERWRLFKYNFKRKSSSREGTPRSDRKMDMRMYNMTHMPGSKTTTLERQEPITDAWITRLPPANHYEEKSKTLKFEPEEENMIVAEVLQDNPPRTMQPVVMTATQPTTRTIMYQEPSTNYVPYKENETTVTHLRKTTPATSVGYEPYHVHLQVSQATTQLGYQLSQTARPAQQYTQTTSYTQPLSQTTQPRSGRNEIFIQPHVPASNVTDNQAGVVMFDSDDEAGNIPAPANQSESVVLF